MKPVYRYDIEQNTDEWHAERVRKIGASNAADLLMSKTTVGYTSLVDRLIEETITGCATESKKFKGNAFTERGHEFEPMARQDYELRTFTVVKLVGVVQLGEWAQCSPDGLIKEDTLHQIKCPIFNTQRKYLSVVEKHKGLSDNEIMKKIDGGYYKQCQYEMYVCHRKYNVFTSFHPNLPAIDLRLERDEELMELFGIRLMEIENEVLTEVEKIKQK